MVDRRDVGSWLEGPGALPGADSPYPGARLGRPESGSGAVAGSFRRLISLVIDWALCLLIVRGFGGAHATRALWPVAVLVVENILLVGTAGATLGQVLVGVRVETLAGGRPAPLPTVIRAALLGLVIPAITLAWQQDHRGLHETASGTLVARR